MRRRQVVISMLSPTPRSGKRRERLSSAASYFLLCKLQALDSLLVTHKTFLCEITRNTCEYIAPPFLRTEWKQASRIFNEKSVPAN